MQKQRYSKVSMERQFVKESIFELLGNHFNKWLLIFQISNNTIPVISFCFYYTLKKSTTLPYLLCSSPLIMWFFLEKSIQVAWHALFFPKAHHLFLVATLSALPPCLFEYFVFIYFFFLLPSIHVRNTGCLFHNKWHTLKISHILPTCISTFKSVESSHSEHESTIIVGTNGVWCSTLSCVCSVLFK